MAAIISKHNPKLVVQMCFGPHGTHDFAKVALLIEKCKPDVIGGEGADLSYRSRKLNALKFKNKRAELAGVISKYRKRQPDIIRSLFAHRLFKGEPGFLEYTLAEAYRRNIAWFPLEAHKTQNFGMAESEKHDFSILASSLMLGKGKFPEAVRLLLLASKDYAGTIAARDETMASNLKTYKSGLLGVFPELAAKDIIFLFSHFGSIHTGVYARALAKYATDSSIHLQKPVHTPISKIEADTNLVLRSFLRNALPSKEEAYSNIMAYWKIFEHAGAQPQLSFPKGKSSQLLKAIGQELNKHKDELLA